MKNKNLIFVIILIVAVIISFYGGMKYQQNKSVTINQTANARNFNRFGVNGNATNSLNFLRQQIIIGEIIAKDDQTLTIKLPNGGSQIVVYSNVTKVEKNEPAKLSDLKVGQNVMISTQSVDQKTLSATSIQIR
ncbi:MAG: hypothetical protein ACPLKV_03245 [Minisyncoccia bacterium]